MRDSTTPQDDAAMSPASDGYRRLAERALGQGAKFPFDASDSWWSMGEQSPPPASDWAHAAARGIVYDLSDRRGIKRGFEKIEHAVREEIVGVIAEIIRAANNKR